MSAQQFGCQAASPLHSCLAVFSSAAVLHIKHNLTVVFTHNSVAIMLFAFLLVDVIVAVPSGVLW